MQNLKATTSEVVHLKTLWAVHYKPLQEVHSIRYSQIHSISTSNHNLLCQALGSTVVVIHSISTSNHNLSCFNALFCGSYMAFELYKILDANTKEVVFDEFSARY